jgi:hypothetical protein
VRKGRRNTESPGVLLNMMTPGALNLLMSETEVGNSRRRADRALPERRAEVLLHNEASGACGEHSVHCSERGGASLRDGIARGHRAPARSGGPDAENPTSRSVTAIPRSQLTRAERRRAGDALRDNC